LINIFAHIPGKSKKPSLYSKKTEWNCFRVTLDELITLEIALKTEIDIEEAAGNITKAIKKAAWQATPDRNEQNSKEERPIIVKQKIVEKKARKRWQLTRQTKLQQTSKRTRKFVT
jgi:hypothetical protein